MNKDDKLIFESYFNKNNGIPVHVELNKILQILQNSKTEREANESMLTVIHDGKLSEDAFLEYLEITQVTAYDAMKEALTEEEEPSLENEPEKMSTVDKEIDQLSIRSFEKNNANI